MDTNFFNIVLLTMIFLILLWLFDEGILLVMFGLALGVIAYKFTALFTITDVDIILIFRMMFVMIGICAFGKSIYLQKESED